MIDWAWLASYLATGSGGLGSLKNGVALVRLLRISLLVGAPAQGVFKGDNKQRFFGCIQHIGGKPMPASVCESGPPSIR